MTELHTVYKKMTSNIMIQVGEKRKDEKRYIMQTMIKRKNSEQRKWQG